MNTQDPAKAKVISQTLSAKYSAEFGNLKNGMSKGKSEKTAPAKQWGLGPRNDDDMGNIGIISNDGKRAETKHPRHSSHLEHIRLLEVTSPNGLVASCPVQPSRMASMDYLDMECCKLFLPTKRVGNQNPILYVSSFCVIPAPAFASFVK